MLGRTAHQDNFKFKDDGPRKDTRISLLRFSVYNEKAIDDVEKQVDRVLDTYCFHRIARARTIDGSKQCHAEIVRAG